LDAELKSALENGFELIEATSKKRYAELGDRLTDLEQRSVGGALAIDTKSLTASPGSTAVKELMNDVSIKSAQRAAIENKQLSTLNARVSVDVDVKSILVNLGNAGATGAATFGTPADRNPNIGTPGLRPLRLLDVLPRRSTLSDSVEYVRLEATGEAAEQESEGTAKAEIDLEGDKALANIVTIAGWTAASRQVLADNQALSSAINTVIGHKCLSRLENRLINGTGGPGKIDGLINLGTVYTPTLGTSAADIVGEAMVEQANRGYIPNLILLNPKDWFGIQITKTTAGEYIFGSPTNPVPPGLWNSVIVTTPSMPQGKGMTIDTRFTTLLDREQMSVLVSNSHQDYFTRNLVAILAELRAGLEVTDAGAVYSFALPSSGP